MVETTPDRTRMVSAQPVIDHAVDRLCAEFGNGFTRGFVLGIVRRCLDDLAGIPYATLPELGERLARQRLLDANAERTRT
jgi:hypothetical protein